MKFLDITLLSNNLSLTEQFYNIVLDLPVLEKTSNRVSFRAGSTALHFVRSEELKPVYHFAFNIPHNQLGDAIAWCETRVKLLPVEGSNLIADFASWNARSIYFFDTQGNILEFIARYDLPNQSHWPFGGSSISCISEIGLVTNDVLGLREKLMSGYAIPAFTKKTKQDEEFAALGTEEALLIMSRTGRHWYPTNIEAKPFETIIRVEIDRRVFDLKI